MCGAVGSEAWLPHWVFKMGALPVVCLLPSSRGKDGERGDGERSRHGVRERVPWRTLGSSRGTELAGQTTPRADVWGAG
jgi:hypothetical protein